MKKETFVAQSGERIEYQTGSGNVYADLGLPDAEEQQMKAQLVMQIARLMKARELTQSELGAIVGLDQPKVSKLLRGHFREFSVARLFSILNRLGYNVEVRIAAAATNPEDARTSVLAA